MSTSFYVPKLFGENDIEFVLSQKRLCIRDNGEVHHLVIPSRLLNQNHSPSQVKCAATKKDKSYSLVVPVQDQVGEGGETTILRRTAAQPKNTSRVFTSRVFRTHDQRIPIEICGYFRGENINMNYPSAPTQGKKSESLLPDTIHASPQISSLGGIGISFAENIGANEVNTETGMPVDLALASSSSVRPSRRVTRPSRATAILSSLSSTVCTLIQNLEDDATFDSHRYAINVLHTIFRGRNVAVATLPMFGKWTSRILCVLVDLPKKSLYGRGRVACVSYCAEISESTSATLVNIACSCWDETIYSCEHTAELSTLSIRQRIGNYLEHRREETLEISLQERGLWKALNTSPRTTKKYSYLISFCARPDSEHPPRFVPVLMYKTKRKFNRQGDSTEAVQCQKCRRASAKRGLCQHEISVIEKLRSSHGAESNLTHTGATNGENSDEEDEGEGDVDDDLPDDTFVEGDNKYLATRKRSVFCCRSDAECLRQILESVARGLQTSENPPPILRDFIKICASCHKPLSGKEVPGTASYEISHRDVHLHTLGQGTLNVTVTDIKCLNCNYVMYFDGADTGTFAATRRCVYSRDILDFWLYHSAGLGGTFREAYELSKTISRGATTSAFSLGKDLKTRRRSSSSCFASFLRTLSVPEGTALSELFSCTKCQDASGRFSGIVMDGTATGILGALPKFERPAIGIPSAKGASLCQFIVQNAKLRKFLQRFCNSARKPAIGDVFVLELTGPAHVSLWSAAEILFNCSSIERQTFIFSNFVNAVFCIVGSAGSPGIPEVHARKTTSLKGPRADFPEEEARFGSTDGDECSILDSSPHNQEEKMTSANLQTPAITLEPQIRLGVCGRSRFRHRIPSRELQTAATNFLVCFSTCSVPATLLRTVEASINADSLADKLISFSKCGHVLPNSDLLETAIWPCEECAARVKSDALALEKNCPAASQLAYCLADSRMYLNDKSHLAPVIRQAAQTMGYVIDEATKTRNCFMEKFVKGESGAGREYNRKHGLSVSTGTSLFGSQLPQENGDFFPGREMVRPRISFLNSSSQPEISFENCVKVYKNANSHSPGLFSVHCVCSNPKLLGVSVMDSSESLSTALSILLTRFQKLPENVYYDNACNLSKSIILRTPWVMSETRLCCDRFHYRSHTCPSVFDPDSFRTLDDHRTSGAEATNARWATSRSHIRFLDGSNLIPFIIAKSIFINLRSYCKEKLNIWDVEDADIVEFGLRVLPCQCTRCLDTEESADEQME